MDEAQIKQALERLPLGGIQVHDQIGSTNDAASEWALAGAADLSLVIAEQQTHGRGRHGTEWTAPAGSGLTFSLILRSGKAAWAPALWTGLGAVAVASALERCSVTPAVKWPNDILVGGRKVCGILTEVGWEGGRLLWVVMGIGLNLQHEAVRELIAPALPATSLEDEGASELDPGTILGLILEEIIRWRARLDPADLLLEWNRRLAYRGRVVELTESGTVVGSGTLLGVIEDGGLLLETSDGKELSIPPGDLHLRAVI